MGKSNADGSSQTSISNGFMLLGIRPQDSVSNVGERHKAYIPEMMSFRGKTLDRVYHTVRGDRKQSLTRSRFTWKRKPRRPCDRSRMWCWLSRIGKYPLKGEIKHAMFYAESQKNATSCVEEIHSVGRMRNWKMRVSDRARPWNYGASRSHIYHILDYQY